jgi:hypothetical protein
MFDDADEPALQVEAPPVPRAAPAPKSLKPWVLPARVVAPDTEWPALLSVVSPSTALPTIVVPHSRPKYAAVAAAAQADSTATTTAAAAATAGTDLLAADGMLAATLVVDTAGFINNCPLEKMGSTLVTLREVIGEVRDKATRSRLAGVLPCVAPSPPFFRLLSSS